MARPQKEGLDYFPIDIDIDQDDKLIVPIAKHGMFGFGVIIKLMMEVYKNGYFYPWTEKERHVFPFKINADPVKVNEIVIDCINSGFFSQKQYKCNQILTSYGFQKRFLMASTRRKESVINERYLVQKELMHTETEFLQAETTEFSAESTQSKLKEIKVNEIKENNSSRSSTRENPFGLFETHKFGKLDDITRDFIGEAIDDYSEHWVVQAIKETVKQNKNSWAYVEKILKRWMTLNHLEPWTLEKPEEQKRQPNNIAPFQKRGAAGKPHIPIVSSQSSAPISTEELERIRKRARELDEKFSEIR